MEAEFDDFKLESWADLVDHLLLQLSKIKPLKAQAIGELLGIENYESKVDPEAEPLKDGMEFT